MDSKLPENVAVGSGRLVLPPSATPQTDAAWRKYINTEWNAEQAIEVSRKLERENTGLIAVFKQSSEWREKDFEIGQRALMDRAEAAEHEADAMRIGNGHLRDRMKQLQDAIEDLMQIVEGVRNERWAVDGRRLKDTPEWCRLYSLRCAIIRSEQNKADSTTCSL